MSLRNGDPLYRHLHLGFISVSNEAGDFLAEWSRQLRRDCIVDIQHARFVDQRWVDLTVEMFRPSIIPLPRVETRRDGTSYSVTYRTEAESGTPTACRFGSTSFSGFDPDDPGVADAPAVGRASIRGSSPRPAGHSASPRVLQRQIARAGYARVRGLPYRFERFRMAWPSLRPLARAYRSRVIRLEGKLGDRRFPSGAPGESASSGYLQMPNSASARRRGSSPAMRAAGIPVSLHRVSSTRTVWGQHPLRRRSRAFPTTSISYASNGTSCPGRRADTRGRAVRGRYSISIWIWEVDVFLLPCAPRVSTSTRCGLLKSMSLRRCGPLLDVPGQRLSVSTSPRFVTIWRAVGLPEIDRAPLQVDFSV